MYNEIIKKRKVNDCETEMASKNKIEPVEGPTVKRALPLDGKPDGEKRQKLSFGLSKPAGLQMKLSAPKAKTVSTTSVFNNDSDDEPEEMPAEARMRMRNIGRETPTSAGPNSFGKTKQGFCNAKKVFEKNLSSEAEAVSQDSKDKDKKSP